MQLANLLKGIVICAVFAVLWVWLGNASWAAAVLASSGTFVLWLIVEVLIAANSRKKKRLEALQPKIQEISWVKLVDKLFAQLTSDEAYLLTETSHLTNDAMVKVGALGKQQGNLVAYADAALALGNLKCKLILLGKNDSAEPLGRIIDFLNELIREWPIEQPS